MKSKPVIIVMALVVCCFLASTPMVKAEEVVKIGGLMTTSGAAAHLGKICLNGIMLKVEEVNAKGGITIDGKKYKIKFINYDDKCVAKDGVSATERLVRRDKVSAIVGAICSHCTLAAMEITEREHVPIVTPISSSVKITSMGYKYISRTWSQAAIQAETISQYAIGELGLKKGAFIGRNDAWCRSSSDEFIKRFKAQDGEIIVNEFYEHGATDFYPQLAKAKNADPDCIYLCSLAEDGAVAVKQARELGISCPIFSTEDMGNEQVFNVAGDAIEGLYAYWTEGSKSDASLEYEKRYKEKYGTESTSPDKGAYDTVGIVIDAIERAGTSTDGEKIQEALAKTDYDGIRQRYRFSPTGQAEIDMWVIQIRDKKIKYLKEMDIYNNPSEPL